MAQKIFKDNKGVAVRINGKCYQRIGLQSAPIFNTDTIQEVYSDCDGCSAKSSCGGYPAINFTLSWPGSDVTREFLGQVFTNGETKALCPGTYICNNVRERWALSVATDVFNISGYGYYPNHRRNYIYLNRDVSKLKMAKHYLTGTFGTTTSFIGIYDKWTTWQGINDGPAGCPIDKDNLYVGNIRTVDNTTISWAPVNKIETNPCDCPASSSSSSSSSSSTS